MNLVGGVGIPNNKLAVLRGGDKVSAVGRPVHGVDLGQMTLEGALSFHKLVLWNWLVSLVGDGSHYRSKRIN